jgi:hypothetical protein
MAKEQSKPSDRGRNTPEPGPVPGHRAEQRDTAEQLRGSEGPGAEQPLGWQWSEQERLPPRGVGSQQNQGEDKQTTVARSGVAEPEGPVAQGATPPGLHTGGTRGPSNQNNKS